MNKEIFSAIENLNKLLNENKETLEVDSKVEIYNKITEIGSNFLQMNHPVLGVKLVKSDDIEANAYNPNKVAAPEMELLRLSIRKDGFTMPVVACKKDSLYEVVDGFHRTTIAKTASDIKKSLHNYVPIVELNKNIEDRITSTVRHNMARGSHQVELSAKLVAALKKHNWTNERIGKELGMDPDEVLRMKQVTGLAELFADHEFSKAWIVN